MKCVCLALVCLGVMGGLIDCSPFPPMDPMDMFPERVLYKTPQREAGEAQAVHDILDIPGDILKKFVALLPGLSEQEKREGYEILSGMDGLDKDLVHMTHLKNLQDPIAKDMSSIIPFGDNPMHPPALFPDVTSQLTDAEGHIVAFTKQINTEARPENPANQNRKRRETPGTKVVNEKPYVETRYTIDNPSPQHIGVSDPDMYEHNKRPIIIYVSNCDSIKIDKKDD